MGKLQLGMHRVRGTRALSLDQRLKLLPGREKKQRLQATTGGDMYHGQVTRAITLCRPLNNGYVYTSINTKNIKQKVCFYCTPVRHATLQ